ncbi:MAG: hypothetical protein JKY48_11305 [Flavobacteriales bacterium]|nr:hypothetical protein [Flavobacteriales bacterium]
MKRLNQFKKIKESKRTLILGVGLFLSISSFAQFSDIQINIPTTTTVQSGLQITSPFTFPLGTPINSLFEVRKSGFSAGSYSSVFKIRTNGNIGLGIDNPNSKLHVHNGRIHITGNNSYGGPMLLFGGSPTNAPSGQRGIEYISTGEAGLNFWKPNGSTNFGNYKMFLADNGKVSIGLDPNHPNTFKGDYNLYVGLGIMTEKLKVAVHTTNDWADYVFKKDYQLLSLSELKDFISEKGHLPNVPSAEEVVEDGIDVAKMDAKLLEKIEELTLYILKQNEKLEVLSERLNNLEIKK